MRIKAKCTVAPKEIHSRSWHSYVQHLSLFFKSVKKINKSVSDCYLDKIFEKKSHFFDFVT